MPSTSSPSAGVAATEKVPAFDVLAGILLDEFNSFIPGAKNPKKKSTTQTNSAATAAGDAASATSTNVTQTARKKGLPGLGQIVTAHKHLKTSFAGSIKGMRKSPPEAIPITQPQNDDATATPANTTTPSTIAASGRSTRSSASRNSLPTPSTNIFDDDICDMLKEFAPSIPVSSQYRGMKRLMFNQSLRFGKGDDFVLVVPHLDRKQPKRVRKQRQNVLNAIRRVVLQRVKGSAEEKEEIWQDDLKRRSFSREGKPHWEFHLKVDTYPERDELEKDNLSYRSVKSFVDEGMGIHVVLYGYGKRVPLKLQFAMLPFVEIYVHRKVDEPYLDDSIIIPKTDKESTMVDFLTKEFHAAKGDTVAYVNIMIKYYQQVNQQSKRKARIEKAEAVAVADTSKTTSEPPTKKRKAGKQAKSGGAIIERMKVTDLKEEAVARGIEEKEVSKMNKGELLNLLVVGSTRIIKTDAWGEVLRLREKFEKERRLAEDLKKQRQEEMHGKQEQEERERQKQLMKIRKNERASELSSQVEKHTYHFPTVHPCKLAETKDLLFHGAPRSYNASCSECSHSGVLYTCEKCVFDICLTCFTNKTMTPEQKKAEAKKKAALDRQRQEEQAEIRRLEEEEEEAEWD